MTIAEYMDEHNQYDVFMLVDQNLEMKFYVYVGCNDQTNVEKLVENLKSNIEVESSEEDAIYIDIESYVCENKSNLLRIKSQGRESDHHYVKSIAEIIEAVMTGYVSEETARKILILLEMEVD